MPSSFLPTSQQRKTQQHQAGLVLLPLCPGSSRTSARGWVRTIPSSTPSESPEQAGGVRLSWAAGAHSSEQPADYHETQEHCSRGAGWGAGGVQTPSLTHGEVSRSGGSDCSRSPTRGSGRPRLFRAAPLRAGPRRGGEEGGAAGGGTGRVSWQGQRWRPARRGQVRENFVESARGGGAPVSASVSGRGRPPAVPPPAGHGRPLRPRDVLGQAGPGLSGRGRAGGPGAAGCRRFPRLATRPAAPPCRPPRPPAARRR